MKTMLLYSRNFHQTPKYLLINREFKTTFETFLLGMIANNVRQNEEN